MNFIWFILIGAIAGWFAGQLTKGSGFGLFTNILLGIVGSIIGGWLFDLLNIAASGKIGAFVTAAVGALIVLFIAKSVKK